MKRIVSKNPLLAAAVVIAFAGATALVAGFVDNAGQAPAATASSSVASPGAPDCQGACAGQCDDACCQDCSQGCCSQASVLSGCAMREAAGCGSGACGLAY